MYDLIMSTVLASHLIGIVQWEYFWCSSAAAGAAVGVVVAVSTLKMHTWVPGFFIQTNGHFQ